MKPGECLELGIVRASRELNHKLGLRPSWSGSATPLAERKSAQSLSQEESTFRHVAELSAAVVLLSSTFPELKLGLFIAPQFAVAVKKSRPSDAT